VQLGILGTGFNTYTERGIGICEPVGIASILEQTISTIQL